MQASVQIAASKQANETPGHVYLACKAQKTGVSTAVLLPL